MKVDGGTVTISGGGTYVISGELSNGRIVVKAPKADVRLVLKGASITSSDGPAIDIQDAGNAIVVLAKDSKNTLTDSASYASGAGGHPPPCSPPTPSPSPGPVS